MNAPAQAPDMFPEVASPPVPDAATDEWYTPDRLWLPLHREFKFGLDVCATAESTKVPRYFDLERNGLKQRWSGWCWCNPPYSDIAPWAAKAEREVHLDALGVVMLLPAWTDRAWWHEYIEPQRDRRGALFIETRFVKGRVRFGYPGNPQGKGQHGGGFDPSVLVIWRRPASLGLWSRRGRAPKR